MDWLATLLKPEILLLLLAVIIIVGFFTYAAIRSHRRYLEQIDQIKNGFDPDFNKKRK